MSFKSSELALVAYGELLGVSSGLARAFPLANRLIAASNDEFFRLSRWRRVSQHHNDISNWVAIKGSDNVDSIRPVTFDEVALLSISTKRLRNVQERFGGRHAVAYRMGQTVMVGTAVRGPLFEVDSDNPERAIIAMGIGKGDTDFAQGVITRQYGFMSLIDDESYMARLPLEGLQIVHT